MLKTSTQNPVKQAPQGSKSTRGSRITPALRISHSTAAPFGTCFSVIDVKNLKRAPIVILHSRLSIYFFLSAFFFNKIRAGFSVFGKQRAETSKNPR